MFLSKALAVVVYTGLLLFQSTYALQNLVQLIQNTPELSVLNSYVRQNPDLKAFYRGLKDSTCFLTEDSRLSQYPSFPVSQRILSSPRLITDLFKYGCIPGRYPTSSFNKTSNWIHTYLNDPLVANVTGGQALGLVQDGSNSTVISEADLDSIDNQIVPKPGFKPRQRRHQTSVVLRGNIEFSGGLAHIVDELPIFPPKLTVLAQALNYRGLLDILIAQTPQDAALIESLPDITVIVFSNKAVKLVRNEYPDQGTPRALAVLTYNSVNGTVVYPNLFTPARAKIQSLQGEDLTFTLAEGSYFIDQFSLESYQIMANGILLVVDGVPLPPSFDDKP